MYSVRDFSLPVDADISDVKTLFAETLGVPADTFEMTVLRESIDARDKRDIRKIYQLALTFNEIPVGKAFTQAMKRYHAEPYDEPALTVRRGSKRLEHRPIIVGFGPAGIFAAYLLAAEGYAPLVLEQGDPVDERRAAVDHFWRTGILDVHSNVQFGEGGAGTFSDGKLMTRVKDPRVREILRILVEHGAPRDILYKQKPHIGTDLLGDIMRSMREKIIADGGEVRFRAALNDLTIQSVTEDLRKVVGVTTDEATLPAQHVILATGHSARATFRMLADRGVRMEPKPFAVGFRIEHTQDFINRTQYGDPNVAAHLGAAEYRLTYRNPDGKHGVYTFCMCPGGEVVNASSQLGRLAVNGMSYHARDGRNANSAIICQIGPDDYGEDLFAGLEFQETIEEKAFRLGGEKAQIPVQSVGFFMNGDPSISADPFAGTRIRSACAAGTYDADLRSLYPPAVTEALRAAINDMDRRLPGFADPNALLSAPETRSSSPLRVTRSDISGESVNTRGLFPAGEGAGYAGGIVSSALDGIKQALRIIGDYAPFTDN